VSAEILTGRTTRPVTFMDSEPGGDGIVRLPAGTLVYADADSARAGLIRIRVPGTLLEQKVSLGAVEPE
jgi:hypothetical protein